jgi:hypothetical protein
MISPVNMHLLPHNNSGKRNFRTGFFGIYELNRDDFYNLNALLA